MSAQTPTHSNSSYESTKSRSFSNQSKDNKAGVVDNLKKINEDHCSSSKKSLVPFQKLWNDEDEIFVLEEAIRYKKCRGSEPNSNMNDFHGLLDQSLKQNYSKSQVSYKLRRFKRKYMSNVTKVKSKSVSRSPHEKNVFVLSEKIWGKNSAEGNINPSDFISDYSDFIMSGFVPSWSLMKKYMCSVEKKQELEKRWMKLAIDEMELIITKCELVNENARRILEALNSSHQ